MAGAIQWLDWCNNNGLAGATCYGNSLTGAMAMAWLVQMTGANDWCNSNGLVGAMAIARLVQWQWLGWCNGLASGFAIAMAMAWLVQWQWLGWCNGNGLVDAMAMA
ncbi:hypothetical protein ACTFIR_012072 [Dictyostelium discoideum]